MAGKWWLVTWTTYGTWLPGDPRGFQTWRRREYVPPPKRYAKPGEATYQAANYSEIYRDAQDSMTQGVVVLTEEQQETALAAIFEEMSLANAEAAALTIGRNHCHLLARFSRDTRNSVGRLKAAATKQIHRDGFKSQRVWCRNCHMKSKATDDEFLIALRSVARHRGEGASVFVWPDFQHLDLG